MAPQNKQNQGMQMKKKFENNRFQFNKWVLKSMTPDSRVKQGP